MRFDHALAELNNPSEMSEATKRKERQFVSALARGLEVLRCFEPGEGLLGNQEIAARTGLPKPTVSRLTYTLTKLGYLSYSDRLGKYYLGTPVLSLGYSLLSNMDVRKVARPLMQELAEHAKGAVALGARDRLHLLYVENCRSSATLTLNLEIGSRIPIATTAMGRALMCALPERERDFLLDHIRRRNADTWPQLRDGIETALRDYQRLGFCMSVGEWHKDVNAVAAPMVSWDGSTVLCFNCGGPGSSLKAEALEHDIGPRLLRMIARVKTRTRTLAERQLP